MVNYIENLLIFIRGLVGQMQAINILGFRMPKARFRMEFRKENYGLYFSRVEHNPKNKKL